MTLVKVCGITTIEDARLCVDAGVYALGFNFYPKSPRYIEPSRAAEIIDQLPSELMTVGVFVNEDREFVKTAAATSRVTAVQLHGDETPSFCDGLADLPVIKALRVRDAFDPAEASQFATEAILLDAFCSNLFGGSGKTFNWELARRTKPLVKKLFLAGGLDANNVRLATQEIRPFAVDVCSGVESVPGRKDSWKLSGFMKAIRKVKDEF